jgi:hypothetical protein
LAGEFGWTYPEIDAMRMRDVDGIIAVWRERDGAPSDEPVEPEHISEEDWQRLTRKYSAAAEGTRNRNPFT